MKRPAALLGAFLILMAGAPGLAQEQREEDLPVRLRLLRQTPFATPDRPLKIRVGAENPGDTGYRNLALRLWLYPAARSRSAYDQALQLDPLSPLEVTTIPIRGTLGAGAFRRLPGIQSRAPVLREQGENALYPIKIQLTSADVPIAELRTVLVYVEDRVFTPLNVALTFVLDVPVRTRPDGVLLDPLVERAVAPGGRVTSIVTALEVVPVPATLVISPILLEELRRMEGGYTVMEDGEARTVEEGSPQARRAGAMRDRIIALGRRASPAVEVIALPYASPSVPALVSGGLAEDLRAQTNRGNQVVANLLGDEPPGGVFRPPGGRLTAESLDVLAVQGSDTLLMDARGLSQPEFNLTPSPIASLTSPAGRTLLSVAADAGVAARMGQLPDDPRLRAQRTIGELAAIYFEEPSTDRGVSLIVDGVEAEPAFLTALLGGMASVPTGSRWLRPVTSTRLLAFSDEAVRRRLTRDRGPSFSQAFLDELAEARSAAEAFVSVMPESAGMQSRLRTMILQSESRAFLGREDRAEAFLHSVQDTVDRELSKVELPAPGSTTTLTAQGGVIPVTLRKATDQEVRVRLTLLSSRLEFIDGASREVVLSRPVHRFDFPVRAQTTGRFPVNVVVESPTGRTIGESRILVRSTAYNRAALFVTIGAGLFLAIWWSRRFWRKTRTS